MKQAEAEAKATEKQRLEDEVRYIVLAFGTSAPPKVSLVSSMYWIFTVASSWLVPFEFFWQQVEKKRKREERKQERDQAQKLRAEANAQKRKEEAEEQDRKAEEAAQERRLVRIVG